MPAYTVQIRKGGCGQYLAVYLLRVKNLPTFDICRLGGYHIQEQGEEPQHSNHLEDTTLYTFIQLVKKECGFYGNCRV
jgi:hypothetical protein